MAIPPITGLIPTAPVGRRTPSDDSPGQPRPGAAGSGPELEISPDAQKLHAVQELLHAFYYGVETELDEEMNLFDQAGRADYLDTIENPNDLSSNATASRILGGITGYIYGAFRLGNPDATAEDFERFESQVRSGFERGLGDAKELLTGLAKLTPELAGDIDQTESLVRTGLDEFFERERERYATAS